MTIFGLCAQAAHAAGNGTGLVTGYITYSIGQTEYFFLSTTSLSGQASCNDTNRFVISSADSKFKTTVAIVLAAYAAGTPVNVLGAGTCSAFNNSEDIYNIVVGSIAH